MEGKGKKSIKKKTEVGFGEEGRRKSACVSESQLSPPTRFVCGVSETDQTRNYDNIHENNNIK